MYPTCRLYTSSKVASIHTPSSLIDGQSRPNQWGHPVANLHRSGDEHDLAPGVPPLKLGKRFGDPPERVGRSDGQLECAPGD